MFLGQLIRDSPTNHVITSSNFSYCTVIVEDGKNNKEFLRKLIIGFDIIKTYKEIVEMMSKKSSNLLRLSLQPMYVPEWSIRKQRKNCSIMLR